MPLVNPALRGPSLRLGITLALGGSWVLGCGGSPTGVAGQGAANLPPQTNPGVADKDKGKKGADTEGPRRDLKGSVTDALTGAPVENAVVVLEGLQTTVVSTPIPAAPSPSKDELDDDGPAGGGGGPGRSFRVAQADNPVLPSAETTVAPSGSPSPGSASPSGSPSLPSSPAAPDASASPAGPAASSSPSRPSSPAPGAASPTPAPGASPASPGPGPTPLPVTTYRVDSQGRFELKGIPEGSYNLTFWAPGYQAVTYQGALQPEAEVRLRPLSPDAKQFHTLKGVVRQANDAPASGVAVEISSMAGKLVGQREESDAQGAFAMTGIPAGNYAAAAWTTNLEGEVATFAMVREIPVALGRERRSVSPTLRLLSVTAPLLLAGTVEGSAKEAEVKAALAAKKPIPGVRPTRVSASIRVGDGEIPLVSVPVGTDGYFRLRLPSLPEGATYHLTASGQSEAGQTSHRHLYDMEGPDPKLSLTLPGAPDGVRLDVRTKHPRFSWDALGASVNAYRLSVERLGDDGDTLWEAWTTGTTVHLPNTKELPFLREGESYRYTLAAVTLLDDKKFELSDLADRPWEASALTRPQTFEVVRLKPGGQPKASPTLSNVKPLSAPPRPPRVSATASPSPAATGKPKPKSPRIKPLELP
ncbi:MAG: hypothetical protein VKQ33_02535 [Candidatus Sericytochromatia bacterium]|nr:hypothetical protein [Candidatus Sericytochromatia bacterium]